MSNLVALTNSRDSISFFANGKMYNVPSSAKIFEEVRDLIRNNEHTVENMVALVDKAKRVVDACEGLVTITDGQVFFDERPVNNTLSAKLLAVVEDGWDPKAWMRFMENLEDNPSYKSRKALYDFLDHFSTPITEDGHFLAFKRVSGDYKDLYTRTMDNSPGTIVSMDRTEVDDDSNRTCSAGLHACASNYLGSFYANSSDARVVVVKINPRDVVAVPHDYEYSKMRVCRYEVLGDAEEETIHNLSESSYTEWDTKGDTWYDTWSDDYWDESEADDDYWDDYDPMWDDFR